MQLNSIRFISMKYLWTIAILVLCTSFNGGEVIKKKRYKLKTVVIDPGHGGTDPGALGKNTKEKDITLAVSLELGALIRKNMPDVKVIFTRESDVAVPLYKRSEIANKNKADLFISVHCNSIDGNAAKKRLANGMEVYVMGQHVSKENLAVAKRENSVILLEEGYQTNYGGFDPNSPESMIMLTLLQNNYLENSIRFAELVEGEFRTRAKRPSRGVKQAGFLVLRNTAMPSILIELGFISHPDEETYMKDPNGQSILASAIFRAFRDYKQEMESY